jgi:cyclic beta-1,2-glucan synthetase
VRTSQSMPRPEGLEARGKVFILRADLVTAAQRDALQAAARVALSSRRGTLADQIARADRADAAAIPMARRPPAATPRGPRGDQPHPELEFFNGLGGFTADAGEYRIVLKLGRRTPAPWINVLANPGFGCLVSESGSGCTWSANSRENQLTAWSNDPVSDPPSEVFYVRDDASGDLWCPTPLPIREELGEYVARHGQGYTRFEYDAHGVALELLQFVPTDDPVKISRLTLTNHSSRSRRLSVTAYLEWVLGVSRGGSAPFVITEIDPATGAMFARNTWRREFNTRVAFADLGGAQTGWTGDRTEFLGRNGTDDQPAALVRRERLSGRSGAAFDPCCALQTTIDIPAGGHAAVVFALGEAATREEARAIIRRYRTEHVEAHLKAVTDRWDRILGTVQVTTPDRALNLMLNHWMLYQTLASRMWARTAFYQASGAFGFRDQLQDVMALTVALPAVARNQVLKAASRQFVEGDVQHWWHEPGGRGVRTRISDDLLWLPYVASHYLEVTGETAILDEAVSFLEGPVLAAGELESYFEPHTTKLKGTLFEHCARAIDRSLALGAHGLPLMGTGDWNDGMNRVGAEGKGESVWLAWFLHAVLEQWAPLAQARGECSRAAAWKAHAAALRQAIEREAWDGSWYRRAYFDDGTPLGSATNDECAIDSIAQSWSVISGAADPARARLAMASLDERLVRPSDGLILLLAPPFDKTPLEPGYIKGYVPGVRENGGQYTHAAAWAAIAFAALGDGDKVAELLAMLNPISHAATPSGVRQYKVEPYVVAADVYSESPHTGRGGWTWYTGSSGWLYRAGIEWLLGFRKKGERLELEPCIPRGWPGFSIAFRHCSTHYNIIVENPQGMCRGVAQLELDGVKQSDRTGIALVDDEKTHRVRVVLG